MAIGRLNIGLTGVQPGGLAKVIPSSVAVGSGSGSVDSNGTVSFTGASSVNINGIFSATYKNYRCVVNIDTATPSNFLRYRFNTNGTDNTNNNYVGNLVSAQWSGTVFSNDNLGTSTVGTLGWLAPSAQSGMTIDIFNPFAAFNTAFSSLGFRGDGFGTWSSGWFSATTSFTGISLIPAAGTITGFITTYGYN